MAIASTDEEQPSPGNRGVDRNAARRLEYEQRKSDHRCTRCGRPAVDGDQYCRRHGSAVRKAIRLAARRLRKRRKIKKRCKDCGGKSKTTRCLACSIRQGRAPGNRGVDHRKLQGHDTRIETDGYQRRRFHGQGRRGAPSKIARDSFDLKIAMQSLTRAAAGCAAIGAHPDLTASDRDHAELAWLDQVALVSRIADELLDRNRYTKRLAKLRRGPR